MRKKEIYKEEKINRKENLSSYVVKYIKNKILRGQYSPNEQIKENYLAKELEMSRAPIREALKLLE
ncbi:MAG: GntR family transcriptional regulator, partial [Arcobacteraceae bacterium]